MDNIRAVLGILFGRIPVHDVENGEVLYNNIPLNTFMALANEYVPRYSNDEVINLYTYLKGELGWLKNKLYLESGNHNMQENINVYDALYLFASDVLVEEDGEPVCQYINFLRWNEMTKEIDEDCLITAYLARKDFLNIKKRESFFWKPVIGHNSRALNRILERGTAENHFHLKGSAPLFHVSWISLMNNVTNSSFRHSLIEYDRRRLHRNIAYKGNYREHSLYTLYLKAAFIRLYLFGKIQGNTLIKEDEEKISDWLNDELKLEINAPEIQSIIDYLQERYGNTYDYAISESYLQENKRQHLNEILSGERWLLYQVFYKIYSREKCNEEIFQLFYIYLIIKNIIRAEIVQVNSNVGFDNFFEYQNRKENFIDNTKYESVFVRMAVKDTILNQHIHKLEARITPKESAYENMKNIDKLDKWVLYRNTNIKLKQKYFYTVHFIKVRDGEERYDYGVCRHYRLREKVKREAKALAGLRENYPEYAERIRGIDASSSEIVCPPEVFAQAFRYLKIHEANGLFNLRATYHVGEDFLDITGGLRAIDEAIVFLNMKCGDRLGHALALGTDVKEWYGNKANLLLINKMDYLDNLVWLYGKLRKFRLDGYEDAVRYIKKRYDELVRIVYWENSSRKYYDFSINTYYDAWKLRGDNPRNYINGNYHIEDIVQTDGWDYCSINREYPANYKIRYDEEIAYIYYLYHYNTKVKKEGDKMMEVHVNPVIIKAVEAVQKRMQIEICEKGIGIETNPSSNCFIGSFKRYDKHPVVKWYNFGLVNDQKLLMDCPQLLVSINTDDQGVFNTYLENEYSYMALALEKMKNDDGTPKYNRTMILNWLDNIRQIGLDQSFL